MTPLQPRALAHRGVVEAIGFFFDTSLRFEEEARRRALSLWIPGATVTRLPGGLVLRLPSSRRTRCTSALGTPLVAQGGVLLAAPLTKDEFHILAPPSGSLILVQGGEVVVINLLAAIQEDPAFWLDISGWSAAETVTLGSPPARPRIIAEPQPFDPRAHIPGIPKEDPERSRIVQALREAAQGNRPGQAQLNAGKTVGDRARGWLRQALVKAAGPAPSRAPESNASLREKAHWAAARMLKLTGLADVIGRRQAEYIGRMMEMFERGDLNEALRHAISMGELEARPKPPAFGLPTPRTALTLSMQPSTSGSSYHLAPDLHAEMRMLYRKAFQQLEGEGRIDEAAFALSELLGAHEEAVAFLEHHDRYRLAAELAEGRDMSPGLVVRLWFLAGEKQRAVLVAKRTGAFADAVLRLERTTEGAAKELRILWAEVQAASGDFEGAMAALRPLQLELWENEEDRSQMVGWMDKAIAQGGQTAARMLARKLALVPQAQAEIRMQALTMLEDENGEVAPERLAFATALIQEAASPVAMTLARAAGRSLLRDAGAGYTRLDADDFQRLLKFGGDGPLRADMPPLPRPQSDRWNTEEPLLLSVAAGDCGALRIYDAVFLPGGRSLVAMGEAGVRLLARDGRTVTHFEQPAHRLVISDTGHQALALAPRGAIWRMARLDLITRKAEKWQDASLRAFAPDYDGALWFVAIEKDFLALDMNSHGFDAIWRLPNLEGYLLAIARSNAFCSFLSFQAGTTDNWGRPLPLWTNLECWTHSLPNLFLRDRKEIINPPITSVEGRDYARCLAPEGGVYYVNMHTEEDALLPRTWTISVLDPQQKEYRLTSGRMLDRESPKLMPPTLSEAWLLVPLRTNDGVECHLLERKTHRVRALFSLGGAEHLCARFTTETLTISDDRGRLRVLDLHRGELLRDLRIR